MPERRRVATTASILIVMMLLAGMSFCMTARQFRQAQHIRARPIPAAHADTTTIPHR